MARAVTSSSTCSGMSGPLSADIDAEIRSVFPPERIIAPDDVRGAHATLREAVRGSHQDYTEGPIGRAIFLLAVPMVLEMAMESIFAIADVFWVAHLGANAVATVGLTESMMTIIYTAAMGLSIGATALVARRTGEHDPDDVEQQYGAPRRVPLEDHVLRLLDVDARLAECLGELGERAGLVSGSAKGKRFKFYYSPPRAPVADGCS